MRKKKKYSLKEMIAILSSKIPKIRTGVIYSKIFKDKSKYNRKIKHKGRLDDQGN